MYLCSPTKRSLELGVQVFDSGNLSFYNLPPVNAPLLGGKINANLEKLARVVGKRAGIALVLYLLQSDVGTLVDLQLKDVDVILGLHQQIHTSVNSVALHLHIQPQQREKHT